MNMTTQYDFGISAGQTAGLQRMVDALDALERGADYIGDAPVRHAISERLVEIRLLLRDGHLRSMNMGLGPRRFEVPEGYALVGTDVLKAWGKYDMVKAACVHPK